MDNMLTQPAAHGVAADWCKLWAARSIYFGGVDTPTCEMFRSLFTDTPVLSVALPFSKVILAFLISVWFSP